MNETVTAIVDFNWWLTWVGGLLTGGGIGFWLGARMQRAIGKHSTRT